MGYKFSRLPRVVFNLHFTTPPLVFFPCRRIVDNLADIPLQPRPANARGFLLIELAMVMLVLGLVLAGWANAQRVARVQQNIDVTRDRLAKVTDALEAYRSANGFYPCPAAAGVSANDPAFGWGGDCSDSVSIMAASCDGIGQCVKNGALIDQDHDSGTSATPMRVREGAVPVKALSLANEYAADAYGRMFSYAVPELLASSKANYSEWKDIGGIGMVNANGDNVLTAPNSTRWAIIGHGSNGAGAWVFGSGQKYLPCLAGSVESRNCDADTNAAAVYAVDQRATPTGNDAVYFDDAVAYQGLAPATAAPPPAGQPLTLDDTTICPDGYRAAYTGRRILFVAAGSANPPAVYSKYRADRSDCVDTDAVKLRYTGSSSGFYPSASGTYAWTYDDMNAGAATTGRVAPWGMVAASSQQCVVCIAN